VGLSDVNGAWRRGNVLCVTDWENLHWQEEVVVQSGGKGGRHSLVPEQHSGLWQERQWDKSLDL